MAKGTIAAQLYTVRDSMSTPEEIASSLKKVAKAGYRAVEMAGLGPLTAQQWKDLLDKNGLTVCASHTGMDRLQSDFDAVVAEHELWGAKQVNIPSMPAQYREGGEQGFLNFAAAADDLGAKLRAVGLRLGYHNHSFEFVRFGKKTGLQLLLENTDPANLMSQIDTYWVQHGGGDPMAWIRLVKGRMPILHVKDMVIADGGQVYAEVGEGNLNWPAIMEASSFAGVEYFVVEQDRCRRDPFESLAMSWANLHALGLD